MLRVLLGAAVALGLLATCAGALAPIFPPADTANEFRPYIFAAAMLLLGIVLAARLSILTRWAAALAALNAALLLLPLLWSAGAAGRGATASIQQRDLKIVTFNMLWSNRSTEDIARFLREADADIIVMQEVWKRSASALTALLQAQYPYNYDCPEPQPCAQIMFAKRPWKNINHVHRSTGHPEMIVASFDDPELGSFRFHSLHFAYPLLPAERALNYERFIATHQEAKGPAIFAGDFNATPWSFQLQRLLASTGLRRHATFLRSWPTDGQFHLPIPVLLIDHVITTPDIRTVAIETGPRLGSDHLPIVARLRLAPTMQR